MPHSPIAAQLLDLATDVLAALIGRLRRFRRPVDADVRTEVPGAILEGQVDRLRVLIEELIARCIASINPILPPDLAGIQATAPVVLCTRHDRSRAVLPHALVAIGVTPIHGFPLQLRGNRELLERFLGLDVRLAVDALDRCLLPLGDSAIQSCIESRLLDGRERRCADPRFRGLIRFRLIRPPGELAIPPGRFGILALRWNEVAARLQQKNRWCKQHRDREQQRKDSSELTKIHDGNSHKVGGVLPNQIPVRGGPQYTPRAF